MNELLSPSSHLLSWQQIVLAPLAAFVISSLVAAVYAQTHQGLSYSRSLIQALVLGAIVAALLMLAIEDNLARGIGIVGSLAIIRFRTNLRDPRDMVFVFAALGVGVACGVQAYLPAISGAATFLLAAMLLRVAPIGARREHDGLLRFQAPSRPEASEAIGRAMAGGTRRFALVTLRELAQGTMTDYAYHVSLLRPDDPDALLRQLQGIEGVHGVSWINQQDAVES